METARINRDKDAYATDVTLQKREEERVNEKLVFDMEQQNEKDL